MIIFSKMRMLMRMCSWHDHVKHECFFLGNHNLPGATLSSLCVSGSDDNSFGAPSQHLQREVLAVHKRQADRVLLWGRRDLLHQCRAGRGDQQTVPIHVPLWDYLRGVAPRWLCVWHTRLCVCVKCMPVYMRVRSYVWICVRVCIHIHACVGKEITGRISRFLSSIWENESW